VKLDLFQGTLYQVVNIDLIIGLGYAVEKEWQTAGKPGKLLYDGWEHGQTVSPSYDTAFHIFVQLY
jgi:hypothetical protein